MTEGCCFSYGNHLEWESGGIYEEVDDEEHSSISVGDFQIKPLKYSECIDDSENTIIEDEMLLSYTVNPVFRYVYADIYDYQDYENFPDYDRA